jgi:hypothetical protein
VAHARNPNYSEGRDQEDCGSKPALGKVCETLSQKKGWWSSSRCWPRVRISIPPKKKKEEERAIWMKRTEIPSLSRSSPLVLPLVLALLSYRKRHHKADVFSSSALSGEI